jgi:hypothetical protein
MALVFQFPAQVDNANHAYEAHSMLGAFVSQLEQLLGDTNKIRRAHPYHGSFLLRHSRNERAFDRITAAAHQCLCVHGYKASHNAH